MRSFFIVFAIAIFGFCQSSFAQDELAFHLPDIDGVQVQLEAQNETKLTVVCFLGTECPLAKL